MTHYTAVSAEASVIHANVMRLLLTVERGDDGCVKHFLDLVADAVWSWQDEQGQKGWDTALLERGDRSLKERMTRLALLWSEGKLQSMTIEELKTEFGGGSYHVYDSLPFSYALFFREPSSFGSILDAVNAGGDNDTNAKFVGEMLGASHGLDFFLSPENRWAAEGLKGYGKLLALADEFCDTFGIEIAV